MTESAERQKRNYPGQNTATPIMRQRVLLDDPNRIPIGQGPLEVISDKKLLTLELQMGSTICIVHI